MFEPNYIMQEEKKQINYPRKIVRVFLKIILFLLLFVVLVFLLVLTPPVQRFLTTRVENYLENKLKTKVEIGNISFGLSGKIALKNIYLQDKTKDTLLAGGAVKAHLNFLKLFSREVEIKDIELQNITVRIKRVLPDTIFNYQYIVDAFVTKSKTPSTTSAPMKLSISDVAFDNVNLKFADVITGNDMFAHIGSLSATIDTLDPYTQHFDISTLIVRNVQARITQSKPLVKAEPLAKDMADAIKPAAMKLSFGSIDLNKFSVQYANDVSAFYTSLAIGQLKVNGKLIDLQNNKIYLDKLVLNNSKTTIRLGQTQGAKEVVKQTKQEINAQKTQGWDFKIGQVQIDNNRLRFDNDNNPAQANGMDYSHLLADSLTLHVNNLVFNTDSIGGQITQGSVREKNGLIINELRGDLLYASTQSYLKDLYIKTPGSEIKKGAVLKYASLEALTKNFAATVFNIDLADSRIQVKDILTFAPKLRTNAALSNPNDVWYLNIIGSGTMHKLNFESLQFDGLKNTHLNANGTLTGLTNPAQAGGNFTISKFHTTQTDLALFTGKRLSTPQMNLPETFDITGTINGNAGKLYTNLNINTSAGFIGVNGTFSNLTAPAALTYNASVKTAGLQVGSILPKPNKMGSLSGNFKVNGKGITPATLNTSFKGVINNMGYNKYQYHNIDFAGFLKKTTFSATANVSDSNINLNLTASGNFSANPSFKVNGMIDSIKTLPLHLTTQPLIFRGAIDATVSNLNANILDANILITKALFVSGTSRLPLDSVQLLSGRNDTANFIRLRSAIATADVIGQYRFSDLGNIIQSSIQPYFSVTPAAKMPPMQPYNFRVKADVVYSPVLSSFIPTLTAMEPLHMEGNFATNAGMKALLTTQHILFAGNELTDLNIQANTSVSGLHVTGNIGHIKSGSSFDVFNTRFNATALNNVVDFSLGIDDQNSRNKYYLSGVVSQPSQGNYALKLRPDSLLLNYEKWTLPADNLITFGSTTILASNFVLQKGAQQLSLASLPGSEVQPLQVNFSNFKLATLTGFVKSDSLLVDGLLNGNITFQNILKYAVFTSNLTINDLSLRQDTLGNLALQVNNNSGNLYNTNLTLTGRGNDVAVTGSFAPVANDIDLNLNVAVRQLQLNTLEGALASAINNASGTVNGTVSIKGKASKPAIQGDLNFNKASFALTLLGSQFNIDNEKIAVTTNGFTFNQFAIRDSANNALIIDGTILTGNFINYTFNLGVTAQNFLALNSTKTQNKLYYGRLNVSSKLRISGSELKPVVDGSLTVNNGTNLVVVVPQAQPGVVAREGIVQFVDMKAPENDTLFTASDSLNKTNVLGMDVAVNIEVKKEAILNVVIDEANGDFLNVQGEAVLSAGIDPSGKITMVGNYTLEKGAYQLSFNFLQRKFEIEKGSTITWTGEPTTAALKVSALYVANTAPLDLVQAQIGATAAAIRNTYLQKLPFEVHLNLTGELLKPIVTFDIVLPQDKNYGVSNNIITQVQARLAQLRQDQGEINKQVFSLLLLGRFVGENPFQSSGGGFDAVTYAKQSVSKLLTEQLNALGASLIQGVDINFDVASASDYTTGERRNRTDLNVGLSKRLLNDRLKITVGSNFALEGPQNSNQQSNNIAGNVGIDYQVSKDGRYMVRFFRKNQYQGIVDGYIIETGLSFILSVDYNQFMQIFNRRKQRVTGNGTNQNPQGQ